MTTKAMIFEYPVDFAKRLKVAAAEADTTMKAFVMAAVEEKMANEKMEREGRQDEASQGN